MVGFLGRWAFRAGLVGAVVAVFANGGWLAVLLGWVAFGYLVWAAWPVLGRHFSRVWGLTRLDHFAGRRGRLRLGRLRGDTL